MERGLQGVIARAGVEAAAIDLVVHGTTLGLNTIIQRKGATLALVVSRGNRDVLEIGRSRMPNSYDFKSLKEEPLVPRHMVFEVDARMTADGTIDIIDACSKLVLEDFRYLNVKNISAKRDGGDVSVRSSSCRRPAAFCGTGFSRLGETGCRCHAGPGLMC